jgi:muramoyltetrapeptide carboxypeptidase
MHLIPNRLHAGDTLALICPASPPPNPQTIDDSIRALEDMGFKVKPGKNLRKRLGFLAGTDSERAGDIMRAFKDKKVQGIVCVRGGYGAPRLLPLLDYAAIQENPKVFVGYSDITALHCAFLSKANMVSFHGPCTAAELVEKDFPVFSKASWMRNLTSAEPYGSILEGYAENTVSIMRRGTASGKLVGGNLSLLVSLMGTSYLPTFKNRILFFEDVYEKPYRLDRMLTQLLNGGLLKEVAGIAIGLCEGCDDPKAKTAGEYRQSALDVFKERLASLKVPIVCGLPFGHVPFNVTLPVGVEATLDGNKGDLILNKPALK